MIRAILAMDQDWGIGKNGDLPWPRNPADLKWFKQTTTGSTVVMGRKTWDSLPVKPLPNRRNIVISHDPSIIYKTPHPNFACPLGAYRILLKDRVIAQRTKEEGVWIIGGATLLTSCLDIIDEIWISNIAGSYDCDVFLPKDTIMKDFTASTNEATDDGLSITIWRKNK